MAADREVPRRPADRMRGTYRALIMFDVGGRAEFAVRPDGEYGHRAPLIVGDEHVLAGGVDTQVGWASALRADGI